MSKTTKLPVMPGYRYLREGEQARKRTDEVNYGDDSRVVMNWHAVKGYDGHVVSAQEAKLGTFRRRTRGNPKFGKSFGNGRKKAAKPITTVAEAIQAVGPTPRVAPAGYRWAIQGEQLPSSGVITIDVTGLVREYRTDGEPLYVRNDPRSKDALFAVALATPTTCLHPVGEGFRLLGQDEVVQHGDEWSSIGFDWRPRTIFGDFYGQTVAAGNAHRTENPRYWRRKVEAPAPAATPAPRSPEGQPPAGYRFLVEGELVLPSDSIWHRRSRISDASTCATVGWKIGQLDCDLTVSPFVRKVEAPVYSPKVGDRVRLTSDNWGDWAANPVWGGSQGIVVGTVQPGTLSPSFVASVKWDNGESNSYREGELSPHVEAPATPAPVNPGDGYRLLGDDEPLLAGDQILDTDGTWQKPLTHDDPLTLRERRSRLKGSKHWPGRSEQIQVRRKVEPAKPGVTAGAGYRLLKDDEVIAAGDQCTRQFSYNDQWAGAIYAGYTVAQANARLGVVIQGKHDPLYYRRPFAELDRSKITIPDGFRELVDGETILATDQYLWGKEWLTRTGTKNVGTSYKAGKNRFTVRKIETIVDALASARRQYPLGHYDTSKTTAKGESVIGVDGKRKVRVSVEPDGVLIEATSPGIYRSMGLTRPAAEALYCLLGTLLVK